MFIDKLIESIGEKNNPTVVGLDPKLEYVPEFIREKAFKEYGVTLKGASQAILQLNRQLIDAIHDLVPAVKPQLAYYEMYGIEGMIAFDETCKYAKSKGLLVIADGKRNDIGATAEAYSKAYIGETALTAQIKEKAFEVDALTVSPYLGIDGIKPFIDDCSSNGKGIFILVKTSNKSSGQLQDLVTQDCRSIYEIMATYVNEWGKNVTGKYGYSSVGAVVGATYPNQAKLLRSIMKHVYILVPGYGTQGGTARDCVNNFNKDGLGAIVNASRSVMCAYMSENWKHQYSEEKFADASRAEVIRMKEDLNKALSER